MLKPTEFCQRHCSILFGIQYQQKFHVGQSRSVFLRMILPLMLERGRFLPRRVRWNIQVKQSAQEESGNAFIFFPQLFLLMYYNFFSLLIFLFRWRWMQWWWRDRFYPFDKYIHKYTFRHACILSVFVFVYQYTFYTFLCTTGHIQKYKCFVMPSL